MTFVVLCGIALAACEGEPTGTAPEGATDLAAPWLRTTLEAVGFDANALFVAGEAGARIDRLRSLVVVRGGRLAYERYYGGAGVDSLADVRSVTKSILATLVGIGLANGLVDSLDQPITDFIEQPEFSVTVEHADVSIRHLLMMTSGLFWLDDNRAGYNEWIASDHHVDYLLDRPFDALPGAVFTYNSAATHLLGVVLQKAVDRPLPDFADDFLFGPLGISDVVWEELSSGYVNGGAGVDLRPRDLAKIGQLFLQRGWSGTRPIVPEQWIDEVTTQRWDDLGSVGPIERLSYGYLWWLDVDREAFFAWGFAGQFIYVAPRLDAVVVATTDWRDLGEDIGPNVLQEQVLGLVVDHVLGAVR